MPPGRYSIGVNGRTYNDEDVYPPTFYSGGPVYLTESGALDSIDLALPPARVPARLRVKVVGPDGNAYAGATVRLDNLQGVQRWFSRDKSDANGELAVPTYLGEHFVVRATDLVSSPGLRMLTRLEGAAQLEVADKSQSITILLRREEIKW